MQIERRALYNSLRMNWLQDPTIDVEPWQVEDYRVMSYKAIFDRIKAFGVQLDRVSFLALTDSHLTPEDFVDELLAGSNLSAKTQDQIYLLVFELWRRLVPEKPCLSIFCDELDYQIHLYDREEGNMEAIQDIIANLQVILDENADQGAAPIDVFEYISIGCANDLRSFIYDFIAEQIDHQNYTYASELLEGFYGYVKDGKWFDFLQARLTAVTNIQAANKLLREIVQKSIKQPDLDFIFEVLSFIVEGGEKSLFIKFVKQALGLLKVEDDFKDILALCSDYFHRLDKEQEEMKIQNIINNRHQIAPGESINLQDQELSELLKIIS